MSSALSRSGSLPAGRKRDTYNRTAAAASLFGAEFRMREVLRQLAEGTPEGYDAALVSLDEVVEDLYVARLSGGSRRQVRGMLGQFQEELGKLVRPGGALDVRAASDVAAPTPTLLQELIGRQIEKANKRAGVAVGVPPATDTSVVDVPATGLQEKVTVISTASSLSVE